MLLALDTATTTASLAVYDLQGNQLLAELTWQARRRQTQDLLVAAQQLLRLVDVAPAALTALAVTTGPGSFTGVRIGISAVKGIGLGLPQPPQVVGLPTLAVTAAPWLDVARGVQTVRICACLQAGRGRYNWAWFTPGEWSSRPVAADHAAGTAADLAATLSEQATGITWLCGEVGADLAAATADLPGTVVLDTASSLRRAGFLASLAARHLAAGTTDPPESLQPIYLRNP